MLRGVKYLLVVIFVLSLMGVETGGQASAEAITLRLGHCGVPGSLQFVVPEKLKENVEKMSNGEIKIQIFPNSQLGNLPQMIGQMRKGSLDIFHMDYSLAVLMAEGKPFIIGFAPYLYKDDAHVARFLESPIFQEMMAKVEAANNCKWMGVLGFRSPRALSTRNKMVVVPGDMKGLKLRSPKLPGVQDALEDWGASTAAIAAGEIYNALKQKVVDGQENGMETVYGYKFYEVQKYYTGIDYVRSAMGWWLNGDKYNSLTEGQRDILIKAGKAANEWAIEWLKTNTQMWFDACRAEGMTMVLPPLKPWVDSSRKVIEGLDGKAWPAGLYDKIHGL